jgi:hypothetical protein
LRGIEADGETAIGGDVPKLLDQLRDGP